jgi:hypothetical protein
MEFRTRPYEYSHVYILLPRTVLGPTQPPIQWVPGALSLGAGPGREADHSPPSSAEVKECIDFANFN